MWYEVLKKVMRLWSGGTVIKSKQSTNERAPDGDVDGFYVFLYDEEEKNTQT